MSLCTFQNLLESNYYPNCPVTPADVRRGITIYGPLPELLQGKTKRVTPAPVSSTTIVNLPSYILREHGTVTIAIDFFAVNGNYFLHTKSRKLHFRTTKTVANRSKSTMLPIIKQVIKLYSNRDFAIHELVGDNEFACISDDISPIQVNIVARDSHVPDAENSAKVMKERIQCILNAPPYPRVPKLMVTAATEIANTMLNDVPAFDSVSSTISPATIVTGSPPTNLAHLRLNFGDYVHLTVETLPYNSMKPRTIPCIALRPTLNSQGSYYFMDLRTGRRRHGRSWQRLPITDDVITAVDKLARAQAQPCMNDGPIFEWGPDMPIDDDVADDDSADDVSVVSVPIVPLLLPQPVPPLPDDDVSIHSAGSTTDADVSSNDDNTASLVPADLPAAPVDDSLVANNAANLVSADVLPDPIDVVADPPDDDVSLDDLSAASADVSHAAPDPVTFDVIADDDAVEVTIDKPTNTYNFCSRSAPIFGSYSNPNNVQLHQ